MRVGIDATPLLGTRTGIGRYVDELVRAIPRCAPDVDLVLTAFARRGTESLTAYGLTTAPRRLPGRVLQAAWQRSSLPPVEVMCGRVDVFHGTNFVLPPTRRAAGVVTIHDLSYLHHADTVSASSLAYRTLVPRGLRRAALVLTVTHAMAAEIHEAYAFPRDRIVVTHPGVDAAWFSATPADPAWLASRGLPPRFLLFVGTREPRKNLDVLLAAYRKLRDATAAPPLVLVGAKGWGPGLAPAGLRSGDVVVAGFVPDEDIRRVVASADCLVMPSRYEGFGLPVLEALACGTPVVASDISAHREVGGDMVRFAPVGDADALAAALERTVQDGGAGSPAGRQAHARSWTWARCALQTVAAYQRALGA